MVGNTAIQRGISEMFEIDRVEQVDGQTYINFARDHQLVSGPDHTIEQVAPERTFQGPLLFEIALSLRAVPLSGLSDVTTSPDQITKVPFTVGELGSIPADSLTVTASSSNHALVPQDGLAFDGIGANRTLRITPASNQPGMATITLEVSDGVNKLLQTFIFRVIP